MIHELKTWPAPFEAVWRGRKTFEIRKADRDFMIGDVLRLKEYDPDTKTYSGREVDRWVTYVRTGPYFELPAGVAMMSIAFDENEFQSLWPGEET